MNKIHFLDLFTRSRSEVALKRQVPVGDWNDAKGLAKPINDELRKLNSHPEQLRGMMAGYYQDLQLQKKVITAEILKNLFAGVKYAEHTLNTIVAYYNTNMKEVLAPGTIKNYYTTAVYLKKIRAGAF